MDRLVRQVPPQVGGELGHARVALVALLLHGLGADGRQLARDARAQLAQVGCFVKDDLLGDLSAGVALERAPQLIGR